MATTYSTVLSMVKENGTKCPRSRNDLGVYFDLSPEDKDRYNADIRATNILLQGLPKDMYYLINHYTDAKDIWDNVMMLLEGSELTNEDRDESQLNQATVQDGRVVVQNVQGRQNRGQGNNARGAGTAGYERALNRQGYALSHSEPQNSNPSKTSCYDAEAQENGVHCNVSSVTNYAYMMIYNDMCEPHAQSVSKTTRNIVVDNSLTPELETYKEQVKLYERRAMFELTEREQKIDEQLRIVITDRNIKEKNLKKELHSLKFQLASTINHNKSMVEEVTSLKKDFKQKENKYLEPQRPLTNPKKRREFLDMKALKEKPYSRKRQTTIKKVRCSSLLNENRSEADRTLDFRTLDFQITQLTKKINVLQEQNVLFGAENGKIKKNYKELYDSIKITCVKHLEQTNALLTENESLKVQIQNKLSCVNKDQVKPKVLAPRKKLKAERPFEDHLHPIDVYTKTLSDLPRICDWQLVQSPNTRDNKRVLHLYLRKASHFEIQCAIVKSNTHKPVKQLNCQKTNVHVPPSTGVNSCTDASGSQPRSNTKKNRILPAKSVNMKKVEKP
ncbi:hypothetical protein Tco_1166336 [Tanacetum coccineum]